MEVSCDSEGWKLVFSGTRRSLLLHQQIGSYRIGALPQQQVGPRTLVHESICAGLA